VSKVDENLGAEKMKDLRNKKFDLQEKWKKNNGNCGCKGIFQKISETRFGDSMERVKHEMGRF
jgi:hypothetical protein